MNDYRELTVRAVERDTDDALCIRFDVPPEQADDFVFEPGQYLTLRADIGGETLERSYSICSGLDQGSLRVAVKHIPDGRFSTFVHEHLAPGSRIHVLPPKGRFVTHVDPATRHRYLAIAGGSGITPILSMIRSVLTFEPQSEFTLLYGNRSVDSIMFLEELDELKDRFMNRFRLHHFLSREEMGTELFSRRIDGDTVQRLPTLLGSLDAFDAIFVCGPAGMTRDVTAALVELGVAPPKIKVERFQNPGQPVPEKTEPEPVSEASTTDAKITVRHNGITRTFDLHPDADSILDGAIAAGIDMPFSCKGGVCATCRARLVEGEVDLAHNYALEPWELAAGYTLTCQARPKSKRVTVDYDDA